MRTDLPDGVWDVRLFGGPCARLGGVTVDRFRSHKGAVLLAYLCLLSRRSHAREELACMLWPDADEEAARTNLRTALASLRRQFEGPGLSPVGGVFQADGRLFLRINEAGVSTDVARFEAALARAADAADPLPHLEEAVSLYGGPLLPAIEEPWATAERGRLHAACEAAKARLAVLQAAPAPAAVAAPTASGRGGTALAERPPSGGDAIPPPAAPAPPGAVRLPSYLNRFFGREAEVGEVAALLIAPLARLVTLTGPGGSGKTRLAVEAARRIAPSFPGGVFFAPLADLREPERVAEAVAAAVLGPDRGAGKETRPPLEAAAAGLAQGGARPALLVLDNAEHLIDAAADAALALLSLAPGLSLLVTSRQRLSLDGEREVAVGPLSVPARGGGTPEVLLEFPSVQLFVHRAQTVRPDFPFNARSARAVAQLCARLEGVPLAIELAAGWAPVLTPQQMLERLGGRLDSLPGRRRGGPERHATLRAAIQWSYDLLPEHARRFFAQLSVFRGGWTLEAAEAVTGDASAATRLAELSERSFVVSEEDGGGALRFRMLETLREFAGEVLPAEERDALRERHAAHFAGLAAGSGSDGSGGANQGEGLRLVGAEFENLRAAQDWWAESGNADGLLGFVRSLWMLWLTHPEGATEGFRRIEAALAAADTAPAGSVAPDHRANALFAAGNLARTRGTLAQARSFYEAAADLLEPFPEHEARRAMCLNGVANVLRRTGESDRALSIYEQSLALYRATGNRLWGAVTLCFLGTLRMDRGEPAEAVPALAESAALCRGLDTPRHLASALLNLGAALSMLGDDAPAERALRESIELRAGIGEWFGVAYGLETLATTARLTGDLARARSLCDEAAALRERHGLTDDGGYLRLIQGGVALDGGDLAAARAHHSDALRLARETGDRPLLAQCLRTFAHVVLAEGDPATAARLWGASDALLEAAGTRLFGRERDEDGARAARAREGLGAEAYEAARREGRSLSEEEAAALAMNGPAKRERE